MEDRNRVFFHELGHFIARQINHLHYNGPAIKSIEVYPHPDFPELYLGDIKVHLSGDGKEDKPPNNEELSSYLASSTYGCFFESYYLKTTLDICFKYHGTDDSKMWFTALAANGYDWLNSDISTIDREYFDYVKKGNELDEIIKLVPEDYLIGQGDSMYIINIDKLKADTKMFVEKHYTLYKGLIEKYDKKFAADES